MGSLSMTKGKVVLLPFPFDDLSATKVRPAICLTDPIGPHRHVIVAFITSRPLTDILETDIVLEVNRTDFAATGIHASSTLRMHRLMTISTALIRRTLGELSSSMQGEVADKLRTLFQLAGDSQHPSKKDSLKSCLFPIFARMDYRTNSAMLLAEELSMEPVSITEVSPEQLKTRLERGDDVVVVDLRQA